MSHVGRCRALSRGFRRPLPLLFFRPLQHGNDFLTRDKPLRGSAVRDARRRSLVPVRLCPSCHGLGAQLRKGDAPEIGFAPIKRVDKHDFFSMWDKQLTVLHWHNDVVGLPAEGQLLSRSSSTKVQAFRLGSALGMQFHLEVCGSLLDEWLDEPSMVKDLKAAGGSKSQLREQFAQYDQLLQPLAEQVFSGFAARCNSYAQTLNK